MEKSVDYISAMRKRNKKYIEETRKANDMPPEDTTSEHSKIMKEVFQPDDELEMYKDSLYLKDSDKTKDPRWTKFNKLVSKEKEAILKEGGDDREFTLEKEAAGLPVPETGIKSPRDQQYIDAVKKRNKQQNKIFWRPDSGGA
jgi:hypothetical protein